MRAVTPNNANTPIHATPSLPRATVRSEVRTEVQRVRRSDFAKELVTILVTSLAFVTGLAWNSAFQSLFANAGWLEKGGPWIYAISISVFAVVVIVFSRRFVDDAPP